jgi:hypothetical protein
MTRRTTALAMVPVLAAATACDPRPTALKVVGDGGANRTTRDAAKAGTYYLDLNPARLLDLVFMIDNSPSMAPKQQKLRENFPRLISVLKNPTDGSLPDLRVAIIDSDLGTNGAYMNSSCGPKRLADGSQSNYGDLGRFQMIGAAKCGVTSGGALWLDYAKGAPVNFTGDISNVFACLAGNLGTMGCGEEHQLQAFEFALLGKGIGNDRQQAMLRADAHLGLVFLSDEDDCSAATNDRMFGDLPGLFGESASLRCATRAHACAGRNLSASPPGYPTDAAFEAPLSSCVARTDACPSEIDGQSATDTSRPTPCSPLRDVTRIADGIKGLKQRPDEQIFVTGIFGWPLTDEDVATATYKIALVPNPNTADTSHLAVWDSWPVCYDPNHPASEPEPTTGYDAEAAGWGATAGLRLSAFVDEFGPNGLKFSICQPDFSDAMRLVGGSIARKMQNLCLPASYTLYGSCIVNFLVPDASGAEIRDPAPVPVCDPQAPAYPCYGIGTDATLCPGEQYYVQLDFGGVVPALPTGTRLEFRCQ